MMGPGHHCVPGQIGKSYQTTSVDNDDSRKGTERIEDERKKTDNTETNITKKKK